MKTDQNEEIPELRQDNRNYLFSFYQEIEKVKVIEVEKEFNKNPIRPAIMDILRNGVEDDNNNKRRYALNALEIKNAINQNKRLMNKIGKKEKEDENNKKGEISYTNLYFHLSKLEEVGAIKKVAFVIERSHKIAYYGRTARFILIGDTDYEREYVKKIFNEFGKFIQALDPEIKLENINQTAKNFYLLKAKRMKILMMILANNEKVINKNTIDIHKLFACLKIIDTISPEYDTMLKKLNNKLNENLQQ